MDGTGVTGGGRKTTDPTRSARPSPPAFSSGFWPRRLKVQTIGVAVVGVPAILLASTASAPALASIVGVASVDLAYSFVRMLAAYLLSVLFAYSYGYLAASSRTGERVLIPILDILQSVPI